MTDSKGKALSNSKEKVLSNEEILNSLSSFGKNMVDQIKNEEPPKFFVPTRTQTNIRYDEEKRLLRLGEGKSERKFINAAHTRKFMQTTMVASACMSYVNAEKTVGKRELYYNLKHSLPNSKENTFDDDTESGSVLDDLECSLDILRSQLHVNAKGRGSVYGDITIKQAGDEFNCSGLGRGGWLIPGNVEDIEITNCNADFILAIENDAMMSRLIEEKTWKSLGCILVTGEGMFPRGVRRFLKILYERLKLPVITFVDGDPYGFYIYSVLKYGSINLAHLSDKYAVPTAKYVGMTMDDIETYNLKNVTEKLKDIDRNRINEEMRYPWFKNNPVWLRQLKLMAEKGIRIEQQALANKSLEFVASTYLPEKIENEMFLD
ncbi:MAG: DNA topoisomerase IV subunit A [Candidatus Diapherotrites archaeon]|nr:DNA topoisomerase IV subunit A [Candidatus Diapherotrites archaeon]